MTGFSEKLLVTFWGCVEKDGLRQLSLNSESQVYRRSVNKLLLDWAHQSLLDRRSDVSWFHIIMGTLSFCYNTIKFVWVWHHVKKNERLSHNNEPPKLVLCGIYTSITLYFSNSTSLSSKILQGSPFWFHFATSTPAVSSSAKLRLAYQKFLSAVIAFQAPS